MASGLRLDRWLTEVADEADLKAVAATVAALADAATEIAATIALGALSGELARSADRRNAGGEPQKALDLIADTMLKTALRKAPVAVVASEETDEVELFDPNAPLAVTIDPIDGSSNIDANSSIGTIFSIRRAVSDAAFPLASFLRPGSEQVAAGIFIYGPQTSLVLTLGRGVQLFVLDRRDEAFYLAADNLSVPPLSSEFAINASNRRHWEQPILRYIDDCLRGKDGPLSRDFNMRWVAAVAVDAHRILMRGGIYLYPADRRGGYGHGRLRLVYEAQPIALLMEQAGGAATDGLRRLLDRRATALHQRTPLVFGSDECVAQVARYHGDPPEEHSPLFGRRGLLRA